MQTIAEHAPEVPRHPAPQAGLAELMRQLLPVETGNVVALRPGMMPRSLTAEEAFVAWALALPEGSDATAAARAALEVLGLPECAGAALERQGPDRFRAYLGELAGMRVPLPAVSRRPPGAQVGTAGPN